MPMKSELPKLALAIEEYINIDNEIAGLISKHVSEHKWQRFDYVEIKGVPLKKNENLFNLKPSKK